MNAKYIMTDRGPIIFPDTFLHSAFKSFHPTSAGMVMISADNVTTYDKSLSLKLEPDVDDADMIRFFFGIGDREKKIKP